MVSTTTIRPQVWRILLVFLVLLIVEWMDLGIMVEARRPFSPSSKRPPFLSHVTQDDLREALQTAKLRHVRAVQTALQHYPTHLALNGGVVVVDPIVSTMTLTRYNLTREPLSALPDFGTELPLAVFVTDTPLFSSDECQAVIQAAHTHFLSHHYNNGTWTQLPSGQYQVAGFWIKDIPAVHEWFVQAVQTKLFPLLARTFPEFVVGANHTADIDDVQSHLLLCVDNAYVFQYTPETGRRTEIHTDSGCLSFTIALNDPTVDFTGGGTWFEGLNATIDMQQGHVTIRPGGVKHCGQAVETGVRYVIGGFCMHQDKPEVVRQLLSPPATVPNVQAALCFNPRFDPSYNVLSRTLQEQTKEGDGDDTTIGKQRQQVLEYCLDHVHPYAGDVAYDLASVYQAQGKVEEAVACLQDSCLVADPMDVEALTSLLMLSAQLGRPDKERLYANRILQAPSAPPLALAKAHCNLGVLEAGQDTEIPHYQASIAQDGSRFAPRYSLACAWASQKNYVQALEEFPRALAVLSPDTDSDYATKRQTTLKQWYVAAMRHMESENAHAQQTTGKAKYVTQEQVMTRFGQLMGTQNFQELLALQKQPQQR